ncbi:MAG: HAD hydrolase family protein [Rhodocyclaceae bacterium]
MERARAVRLVILDADGVLTDGRVIVDDKGVESRNFDIKDGLGLVLLAQAGVELAIVSAKRSSAVRRRAEDLNIRRCYDGVASKLGPYEEITRELALSPAEVCHVGDDLMDLPVMKRVGYPVAVADAVAEVKAVAAWVTRSRGGHGAVRELAERILRAQGRWEGILAGLG